MFGIYFLSGNPTWKVASGGFRQGKRGQKFSSQSINNSCFYTSVNSRLIKKLGWFYSVQSLQSTISIVLWSPVLMGANMENIGGGMAALLKSAVGPI